MYKYCYCGAPNGATANFCQKCGGSFVSLSEAKVDSSFKKPAFKPPLRKNNSPDEGDHEDDDSQPTEVPKIESLAYEIIDHIRPNFTVGDLMSSGGGSKKTTQGKVKLTKSQEKAILNEFKKEA